MTCRSNRSGTHAVIAVVALLVTASCGPPETASPREKRLPTMEEHSLEERNDLGKFFQDEGVNGTFVLLDRQEGRVVVHDSDRANAPFLPASTYKVPHALIALETGVANGPEHRIQWDPSLHPKQAWWPEVWAQDHTLESAVKNSVVWYFQEVAKRVGQDRMRRYVNQFNYGNRDLSGGIDRFWLTGGLRTSAIEQVQFLQRFYHGELGVSKESTELIKDILLLEEAPGYRLSGKSGWVGLGENSMEQVGWLVGYLERQNAVFFYALNLDIAQPEDAAARLKVTKGILQELGLMDPP